MRKVVETATLDKVKELLENALCGQPLDEFKNRDCNGLDMEPDIYLISQDVTTALKLLEEI